MEILEQRTLEACIADLNAVLARASSRESTGLTVSDLPRLQDHFVQWATLRNGSMATPKTPPMPSLQPNQLLSAITLLEDRGASMALHPPAMRRSEIASLANQLELSLHALHDVWDWWEGVGKAFTLAGGGAVR